MPRPTISAKPRLWAQPDTLLAAVPARVLAEPCGALIYPWQNRRIGDPSLDRVKDTEGSADHRGFRGMDVGVLMRQVPM